MTKLVQGCVDEQAYRDYIVNIRREEYAKGFKAGERNVNNEEYYKGYSLGFKDGKHFSLSFKQTQCNKKTGLPKPKFVQLNDPYTTVIWQDGSHTVVKRAEDDEIDIEKAILYAIAKHMCGESSCEVSRYINSFFSNLRMTMGSLEPAKEE